MAPRDEALKIPASRCRFQDLVPDQQFPWPQDSTTLSFLCLCSFPSYNCTRTIVYVLSGGEKFNDDENVL